MNSTIRQTIFLLKQKHGIDGRTTESKFLIRWNYEHLRTKSDYAVEICEMMKLKPDGHNCYGEPIHHFNKKKWENLYFAMCKKMNRGIK